MSKKSYALIALIVTTLIYMSVVRFYQSWQKRVELKQQLEANDGDPFSFQRRSISLAGPQVELMQNPVDYQPAYPQVYLEDTPLDASTQQQQAQDTLFSITQDFEHDLQPFNQDLQTATQGQVKDLADLSFQNLSQLVQENPQIVKVVQKHLNNKEFAAKINEIFSNPQFQQSVQQLQHVQAEPAEETPQGQGLVLPLHRLAGSR